MNIFTRSGLAIVATVAVAVGFAVTAPDASAATPKEANHCWVTSFSAKTTTAINLRSGPGTEYTSTGILGKGIHFREKCLNGDSRWSYGKVESGPNKGKWGWVSTAYLSFK